jgi:hypothetical protein
MRKFVTAALGLAVGLGVLGAVGCGSRPTEPMKVERAGFDRLPKAKLTRRPR